jgi:hypothetical protein
MNVRWGETIKHMKLHEKWGMVSIMKETNE